MIVACATDDGELFVSRHFGDASHYDLYEWCHDRFTYVTTIVNTSEAEKEHADPKKAKHIMDLLLEAHVDVGLSKHFGPNIKRVKERLVPVLVATDVIEEGLAEVQKHFEEVVEAIARQTDRIYLDLRPKSCEKSFK